MRLASYLKEYKKMVSSLETFPTLRVSYVWDSLPINRPLFFGQKRNYNLSTELFIECMHFCFFFLLSTIYAYWLVQLVFFLSFVNSAAESLTYSLS